MVAATVRTVFTLPDAASTRAHLRVVVNTLAERFPLAAQVLAEAEHDARLHQPPGAVTRLPSSRCANPPMSHRDAESYAIAGVASRTKRGQECDDMVDGGWERRQAPWLSRGP